MNFKITFAGAPSTDPEV